MDQKFIKHSNREDLVGKTPEEAFEILKEEGAELSDEQLEQISGGDAWDDCAVTYCPECGDFNFVMYPQTETTCKSCGVTIYLNWG